MPKTTTHPTPEELSAFSLGQLSGPSAIEVETHVSQCEPCCETLLELSASDDTFVELLQQAQRDSTEPTNTLGDEAPGADAHDTAERMPAELAAHPRYDVVQLIGLGGMGNVYLARHRMMQRTVALKVMARSLFANPQAIDRFRREVKAAARLSHPNIVTAFDAEQAGDVHFLVMEYVAGTDLSNIVKARGPLPIRQACGFIRQAAAGLHHAHQQGMVHRDIKPHNLMVTDAGTVKILDFGLACLSADSHPLPEEPPTEGGELTAAGAIMGTPDFISPEQAADAHQADIRSDIYSLGATLYYLLTGQAPFAGRSVSEKLKSHAESEPQPLESLRDDVPAALSAIVRRMMAKDPAARFQSPTEVAEALAPFVPQTTAVERPNAPQPAAPFKPWRPAGGRLVAVGLAAFAMLLIAAGVFYVELGKTTLKFEIDDPNIAVQFAGETISVEHDNGRKKFTVEPGTEQKFVVLQNDAQIETDTLTLHKGQKVALRITVVNGRIEIAASDPAVTPTRHIPLGFTFRRIPAGEFNMGSTPESVERHPSRDEWFFTRWVDDRRLAEFPEHTVRITRPFEMSAHEVTVGQFRKFVTATGYKTAAETSPGGGYGYVDGQWRQGRQFHWMHPGFEQTDDHPVCNLDWADAVAFCDWLSKAEGVTYRLPTEAEWEYACRAGTVTDFYTGDDAESLQCAANLADQSLAKTSDEVTWAVDWDDTFSHTAPVGQFESNAFGLNDMHGNAWEWCADQYDPGYYALSPADDPQGPSQGDVRVFRGGGFDNWPGFLRSADRYSSHSPTLRTEWAGFRVVREIADPAVRGEQPTRAPDSNQLVELFRFSGEDVPGGLTAYTKDLTYSHNGRWLAACTGHPGCRGVVWDLKTRRMLAEYDNHSSLIYQIKFSPDDSKLAMCHWDGTVTLWDPRTGEQIRAITDHDGRLEFVNFSPDGTLLVTGTTSYPDAHSRGNAQDISFRIFEVATGNLVHRHNFATDDTPSGGIWGVEFSPDGAHLLVAVELAAAPTLDSLDTGFVAEFDTGTWKETRRLFTAPDDGSKVRTLRYSRDGRLIATGHQANRIASERWWDDAANSVVRLWDAETFRLIHTLRGHRSGVRCLDFSHDSSLLVSCNGYQWRDTVAIEGAENTIRIWDVTGGAELLTQELPHTVLAVRFSPDGQTLASSCGGLGQEPLVQLWRLPEMMRSPAGSPDEEVTAVRR